MRLASALLGVLCVLEVCLPLAQAQESFPTELINFIKPGMNINIMKQEGSEDVRISMLSDETAALLKDARALDKDKFREKHPDEARKMDEALERFRAHRESQEFARQSRPAKYEVAINVGAGQLRKVINVGKDYVLVESWTDSKVRSAISVSSIKRIEWAQPRVSYDTRVTFD